MYTELDAKMVEVEDRMFDIIEERRAQRGLFNG